MKDLIRRMLRESLNEDVYYKDNQTAWMWISPEDKIIQVPKLRHQNYITKVYHDKGYEYSWDYDMVFDQAIKDGWVRAIYEYDPQRFHGSLSVNGYEKSRVIDVVKYVFGDLLKYGHKSVYIDYEKPADISKNRSFSTFDNEGKRALNQFLNQG